MWKDMLLLIDLIIIMYILVIGLIIVAFVTIESWCFIVKKFRKLRIHIKLWNRWRKNCCGNAFYKLSVLFGLEHPPTFEFTLTKYEMKSIINSIKEDFENDVR